MKICVFQDNNDQWRIRIYDGNRIFMEGVKSYKRMGPAVNKAKQLSQAFEIEVRSDSQILEVEP